MLVRTEKIDPKDYPFKKFIDEQKHLDTDELRHKIKPVRHKIDECLKGKEHLFCDKEQLCPLGKYRRPKKMVEAEERGFASVKEMFDADKKAVEDAKQKEIDELREMVKALMAKLK
jgi:2-methylcitrate dehydratase PrpD